MHQLCLRSVTVWRLLGSVYVKQHDAQTLSQRRMTGQMEYEHDEENMCSDVWSSDDQVPFHCRKQSLGCVLIMAKYPCDPEQIEAQIQSLERNLIKSLVD